jgi:imidazolonepropionase-like amidohydrolase
VKKYLTFAAVAACVLFARTPLPASAPAPKATLIRAGRLLDVKAGTYREGYGILIEGERIKEVAPFAELRARAPKEVALIDLSAATLLPGLIDAHAHLLAAMKPQWRTDEAILLTTQMSPASRAYLGARLAREDLEGGVTSVRNVGHSGIDGDAALRDAIEAGWIPGPRLLAACRKISPPGGQAVEMRSEIARAAVAQDYIGVSTPDDARRAVGEILANGADFIKLVVDEENRRLSPEVLKAAVEEAHRAKVKVAAHATGEEAIRDAVEAGVDSIEHGDDADDATLQAMHARGTFLVATVLFSTERFLELRSTRLNVSDAERAGIAAYFDGNAKKLTGLLARATKAGVKIAAGSDMWFLWPGRTRGEATLLELVGLGERGLSPAAALRAATIDAAELLGWQDRVGSIEPGKLADIVALEGDPLADLASLQRIGFVMKGGEVIRNEVPGR